MRQLQRWPVAPARANGPECLDNSILRECFPRCQLRCCRIVDELPRGCPLGVQNPLAAVGLLEDRGWRRVLRRPFPDITGGQADQYRAELCLTCISRLRNHPVIRRIRELRGVGS